MNGTQPIADKRHSDRASKKRAKKFTKLAQRFTRRGIPVFPLAANGKTPLTRNGFKDATTDPGKIKKWAKQFPNANVGVRTGGASNLVVFDLDRKNGGDGVQALAALCDEWRIELPATYRIRTPSGGEHLYFRSQKFAGKIRNSAGALAKGIDLRGEGGYAAGQGSSIDGRQYECIAGSLDKVATLPKALRLKLQQQRQRPRKNGNGHSEGERNVSLFDEACRLRDSGRSQQGALTLVRSLNLSSCNPPLEDDEVKTLVHSAYKYKNTPSLIQPTENALTDMGNARRLAIANAGLLAYVHELGEWLVRDDGCHWQREEGREYALAKKAARQLQKRVPHIDNLKDQEALSKFAIKSQSKGSIEACLKLAQSEPEISVSLRRFDNEPYLLPLKNGVFDLRTQTFRPTTADDYFSKVCPVVYDATADCPNWLAFLELVQPSRVMRRYLQKLVGLTLVGTAEQEIIIFLYGIAGSGKSTFVNTIMKMLGPDLAITFPTAVLLARDRDGSESELLPFNGARMAVASEVPEERRFSAAMLKKLSSNDLLSARPLFKKQINFAPSHTLWMHGNHLPPISSTDSGVWRRKKIVVFEKVIPKRRRNIRFFDSKLKAELPGILNWALDGYSAWQRTDDFKQPKRVTQATKDYRSENDVIKQFVDECIVECVGNDEVALDLYTAYRGYAIGLGEKPVSNTLFGESSYICTFRKTRRNKGKVYRDIQLIRHGG